MGNDRVLEIGKKVGAEKEGKGGRGREEV